MRQIKESSDVVPSPIRVSRYTLHSSTIRLISLFADKANEVL